MGRFLSLIKGAAFSFALSCTGMLALAAQTPPTNAPAAVPPAPKPGVPPVPPPLVDYYVRYGKILKPSDQMGYPFKLNMPFPGLGEVKIPSQEELDMRVKIEQLAGLSDDEIRQQLIQWPAFSKMSLADDGAMLARIQTFRDYRHKMAQDEAHRLGLTLTPQQQARFDNDFWNRKLQMDRQLAQQLEPTFKAAQQKLNEDLYREFSTPGPLIKAPPAPKPPTLTNATGSGTTLAH
jgi:hypothetical protein